MSYIDEYTRIGLIAIDYSYDHNDYAAIPLLLEALDIAIQNNDVNRIFYTRLRLVISYCFTGETKKFASEFLWCFKNATNDILNYNEIILDRTPKTLLLTIARYVSDLHYYANIPAKSIEEMYTQVKKLFLRCNEGLRPYYCASLKCIIDGVPLGDIDTTYNNWILSDKTRYDDCTACEKNLEIEYFIYKGDYASALQKFNDLLKMNITCHEVPLTTYTYVLYPLAKMDNWKLANKYQKMSYAKMTRDKNFIQYITRNIEYVLHLDINRAFSMFNENAQIFESSQNDLDFLHFYNCGVSLCNALLQNGIETVGIRFNPDGEFFSHDGEYDVKALLQNFQDKADVLTGDFDKRNGNSVVSSMMIALYSW